eukprot:CAMPEP_0170547386 /NCGR_PEP_ID=MMETSP0211-20121228/5781_1 /TAXON_ID=311385 /ORGANISM="Pseudokeronopsis sp., Strain OXSARD2" /LENGTH=42 /DNA_ID= /DNA_START= /DNA_END= /DNA_ORIENTATION=
MSNDLASIENWFFLLNYDSILLGFQLTTPFTLKITENLKHCT